MYPCNYFFLFDLTSSCFSNKLLKFINNSLREKTKEITIPWIGFGYVILIIIKFCGLLLWISLTIIINASRSYIKHSKECFIRYPNNSKLFNKLSRALSFQPTSQCLDIWWNTPPCVKTSNISIFDLTSSCFSNKRQGHFIFLKGYGVSVIPL